MKENEFILEDRLIKIRQIINNYKEYRKIGYRLKNDNNQLDIFDFMENYT